MTKYIIIYAATILAFIFTALLSDLTSGLMFDFNITREDNPLAFYIILLILFITFTIFSLLFYNIIIFFIFLS
jgi:hypothetical protein